MIEARFRFDTQSIEYLTLYDGFPASDPKCVAPEFSVERVLESVECKDEAGVPFTQQILSKLIIRGENDEALKTAE